MALLDPSENQTDRWTFGDLLNQVHANIWRSRMNISCWLEIHEGHAIWLHHVCRASRKISMLNSTRGGNDMLWPSGFLQVQALSQWLCQALGRQAISNKRSPPIVGLLFETGVPYILAVLGCLHAG